MNESYDAGLSHSPYPGLRPFRRDEADIFFGREEQIDQLLGKLESCRFLSVVGTSGCGKSSLVRAGMLAGLEGGFMASAGPRWHVAEMRPGSQPFGDLTQALLESGLLRKEWALDGQGRAFLLATLRRGPLGLVEALRESGVPARTSLLLLVDQFEEIFRFHKLGDSNEATAFVDLLLASARQQEMPIYVVLTMRSDFLGDCSLFAGLPEAMNQGQFLTPRLSRDQCRASVVGPAAAFGSEVEPALVNRVLNDMGTDPDQLPLMQHAMMRVWMRAQSARDANRPDDEGATLLSVADYDAIGGLRDALSKHADEAFDELDADARHVAEVLFRCLSERGSDQRDIRRPVRVDTVAAVAGVTVERVAQVTEVFRRADCSFLTPPAGAKIAADTVLDISHESLIRQWKQLTRWVGDEADSASIYRRLSETARLWNAGKAAFWVTPDLENALAWREREQPTSAWAERYGGDFELSMRFLDASLTAREEQRQGDELRQQRELELLQEKAQYQKQRADESEQRRKEQLAANVRLRFRAVVASVASVAAVALALVAFGLLLNAQQARHAAEASEDKAKQLAEQAREARDHEADERKKAVASERRALEKTLEANDSLGQAAIAQSRSLVAARQTGRQDAALKVLQQVGSTHREVQQLLQKLPDEFRDKTAGATERWHNYLPQLRTEAVGWMTRCSLQEVKMLTYPNSNWQAAPVAFSPDGSVFVRYESDQIQVVDSNTGDVKASAKPSGQCAPRVVAFSKDGTRLFLGNLLQMAQGNAIQMESRTFPDLKEAGSVRMEHDNKQEFNPYAWGDSERFMISADLRFLVASTVKGTSVWEADTGRKLSFVAKFRATSINGSGNILVGRSASRGIWFVETATGRMLREIAPEGKVTAAWISPDEQFLVIDLFKRQGGNRFEVLDAQTEKRLFGPIGQQNVTYGEDYDAPAATVAFHPDGSRFVACNQQQMYVVALPEGPALINAPHPVPAGTATSSAADTWFQYQAESVLFSPSGSIVLSSLRLQRQSGASQRVFLWDLAIPKVHTQFASASAEVNSVSFNNRGKIITGIRNGVVRSDPFSTTTGWSTPETRSSYYAGGRTHSGFTPTGQHYVQFSPGKVSLWETASGRRMATYDSSMPGQRDGGCLPASKDLSWVLVKQTDAGSSGNDAIGILRTETPQPEIQVITKMSDFGNSVLNVTVSDDGRFIVLFSNDWQQESGFSLKIMDTTDADCRVVYESPTVRGQPAMGALFARSGKRALIYGRDDRNKEQIRIVDLVSGMQLGELNGLDTNIGQISLNTDGSLVAFANWDRSKNPITTSVEIWSPGKDNSTRLASGVENVPFIELTPDGSRLMVVLSKKKQADEAELEFTTELWDTAKAARLYSHPGSIQPTVFVAQEGTMAGVSVAATPKSLAHTELWRLETFEVVNSWEDTITALSPDRKYLLLSRGALIDAKTGETRMETQDTPGYNMFSSDSRLLLTSNRAHKPNIRVWDLAGKNYVDLAGPDGTEIFASADLKKIATHDASTATVQVWDGATGDLIHEVPKLQHNHVDGVNNAPLSGGVEFSKDGRFVDFECRGQIRLAMPKENRLHISLPRAHHAVSVSSVSSSPDGSVVASASDDQTVCFWDSQNGRFLGMLEGNASAQRLANFAPDGAHLLTRDGKGAGECVFWRWALVGSGEDRTVECSSVWKNTDAKGEAAAIAPNGDTIALGDVDGTVRILDSRSGKLLRMLKARAKAAPVRTLAFSTDSRLLAAAGDDSVIALWDLSAVDGVRQWPVSAGAINALTFAPNGRLLVSGGKDIRFWNPETGELILTLDKHILPVLDLAIDPSGKLLASASEDKTVALTNMQGLEAELDELGLSWMHDERVEANPHTLQAAHLDADQALWRVATESEVRDFANLAQHRQAASECKAARNWKGEILHLDWLLISDPEKEDLYGRRGEAHAELGQWADAARDFLADFELQPKNALSLYYHALALRQAGQEKIGPRAQESFASSGHLNARYGAIWAAVLLPDMNSDVAEILQSTQSAVNDDPTFTDYRENLGAALYRAGRFEEAVSQLKRTLRLHGSDEREAYPSLWLAMCYQRLDKTDEARQALKKATDWIDSANTGKIQVGKRQVAPKTYTWYDKLVLAIVRREAEGLILGKAVEALPR